MLWLTKLADTDLSLTIDDDNNLTWLINEGDMEVESITKEVKKI